MAQEIEIEFKHLLTKAQFIQMKETLPFSTEPVVQTNHYFETDDQALIKKKCALRIRQKNGTFTGTFKEPHPEGVLETHDTLSAEDAHTWMNQEVTFTENVGKRIEEHNISLNTIKYIGSLTTERHTYTTNNLLYVLDRSSYGNIVDYELEIEAHNFADGDAAHKKMIEKYQLPTQKPITKIERFLQSIDPPMD